MIKEIRTSVKIDASKEKVWKTLTEFNNYSAWNSFIISIKGNIKIGNTIEVQLKGITFKPVVKTLIINREFKWLGHLWIKGLFDGEHKFKLTENTDGTTHFEQSEVFKGVLVRFFAKNLDTNTKKGFETMNKELKFRVENRL